MINISRAIHSSTSILIITAIITGVTMFAFANRAEAVFDQAYLRLNRMTASTATGGLVCAEPSTVGTEADVQVTFPSGFTVNTTASNWTVTTTDIPSGSTAWPGIGTASAVSSQTVTFPSTDLTVGTLYCFNFASTTTLTTGSAGSDQTGTITTRTSGPATIDTSTYAVAVITSDSITVTAAVPPTFTMSLSGNTAALGTLSSSSVTSASAINLNVSTNAANGWTAWVRSTNEDTQPAIPPANTGYGALFSTIANSSIGRSGGSATNDGTPESLAALNSYGYILDVNLNTDNTQGTGTLTIDAEYNGANTNSGGTLLTTLNEIASADGTTAGDIVDLVVRARINAIQPAGADYTDTLIVVANGNF